MEPKIKTTEDQNKNWLKPNLFLYLLGVILGIMIVFSDNMDIKNVLPYIANGTGTDKVNIVKITDVLSDLKLLSE